MARPGTEEVLTASDQWQWVPVGAERLRVAGVDVIDYPAWTTMGFRATPTDGPGDPASAVDGVRAEAGTRGRDVVRWWISPRESLHPLVAELEGHGAVREDSAEVMALDLTAPLPPFGDAPGIRAVVVEDTTALDDAEAIAQEVWGSEPPPPERRAQQLAEMALPLAERADFRVVAYDDAGRPVSTGGCEMADGVARLWSGCTLPEARGRGAFRAVVAQRLTTARSAGCTMALVQARVTTSLPILASLGFSSFGTGHVYALEV